MSDVHVQDEFCLGFAGAQGLYAKTRGCLPAPTCSTALREATSRWPGRNRASDGICGDPAHAARVSDHNPDESGYAHAWDLTHDLGAGVDTYFLADQIRRRTRDGIEWRVKNIISNKRLASARTGWAWEAYTGPNPHDSHMHVSVTTAATHDTSPWFSFLDPAYDELTSEQRGMIEAMSRDARVVTQVLG